MYFVAMKKRTATIEFEKPIDQRILVTLNKKELAKEIKRIIREWGENATALHDGTVTELWYQKAQKVAREKLILYSGALAALVLADDAATQKKVIAASRIPEFNS